MDAGLLTVLRLSKEGYGTPTEIYKMPVGVVLGAMEYEQFLGDYEATYSHLNSPQ